jgi:tetratricopeptide (TPR) repeat protein
MALRQDPKAPQPHYVLGLIARAQNRFEEALAEFDQVLKIDPDDVGANINTGAVDWGLIDSVIIHRLRRLRRRRKGDRRDQGELVELTVPLICPSVKSV